MRSLVVLLLLTRAASADPDTTGGTRARPSAAPNGDAVRTTIHIDDDLADAGPSAQWKAPRPAATALDTDALVYGRFDLDTVQTAPPRVSDRMFGAGEDVLGFRAHARAEGTARIRDRYKVKVAGRADAELGFDTNSKIGVERYEAQIWDTYADAYYPHLDLRVGKQIVGWGTADLLSPNDVVNPRDLRRGIALDPDELRVPVLAVSARAFTGPLSLQGLWLPVAPANRFDLLKGNFAILGPHAATDTERRIGALVSALADDPTYGPAVSPITSIGGDPGNRIETGELGAQASIETRKIDLHAYFLWGHERTPRIRVADELRAFLVGTPPDMLTPDVLGEKLGLLAQSGIPAVRVDYPRRMHVGAALATRIEPLGIKLDAAMTPRGTAILIAPGAGPVLGDARELPQAQATLSVDYDRGSELSAVVEVSHLHVFQVPDGAQVFEMADRDHMTMIGARVSWNPRSGPVTFTGLGFVDADSPSYAVRPAVDLSGNDHWTVELAATVYGGPPGSMGGIYDDADSVSVTVQYGL